MKPAELFSHWSLIRKGLIKVIEDFEESDLSYQPFPDSWPAGQIMVHIANAEEGWFRYVITKEIPEWPNHLQFENYPSQEKILEILDEVHAKTERYLGTLTERDLSTQVQAPWDKTFPLQWVIWHVIEHEIHHRGELSMILGILGKEGLDV